MQPQEQESPAVGCIPMIVTFLLPLVVVLWAPGPLWARSIPAACIFVGGLVLLMIWSYRSATDAALDVGDDREQPIYPDDDREQPIYLIDYADREHCPVGGLHGPHRWYWRSIQPAPVPGGRTWCRGKR